MERDRERDWEKDMERDRERDWEKDMERDWEKDMERDRERDWEKDRERDWEKDTERSSPFSGERALLAARQSSAGHVCIYIYIYSCVFREA